MSRIVWISQGETSPSGQLCEQGRQAVSVDEALERLRSSDEVDVVVLLADAVASPIAAVQRVRREAPHAEILVVVSPERHSALRDELRFAPLVGDRTRLIVGETAAAFEAPVDQARARAQRRRDHEAVIASSLASLADSEAEIAPTGVADMIWSKAPFAILTVDGDRGIVGANPAAVALLGVEEFELLGQRVDALVDSPDWDRVFDADEPGAECRLSRQRDGRTQHIAVRLARRERSGETGGDGSRVLFLWEVTELVEARERLEEAANSERRARWEAERQGRMREEILGVVAHDLRNPLQAVSTSVSILEQLQSDPKDPMAGAVGAIGRSAQMMRRLIDDLLDVTRIETGHISLAVEETDASKLVEEAVEMLRPLAQKGEVRLEVEVSPAGFALECDPGRIVQVIQNLVRNAIEVSQPRQKVRVEAEADGPRARFAVIDQGPGVDASVRPHLFEPFWQRPRTRQGSGLGLGLSIAAGLVEAHSGRIEVDSQPGRGATFRFEIPRWI